jgi:hypothetical protein
MTRDRISIAGLMGLVAIAALILVGLKEGTEAWAGAAFAMTVLVLLGAILNAVHFRGPARATWAGFALFGWAFLLFSFGPWSGADLKPPPLGSTRLLDELQARIHPPPQMIPNPSYNGLTFTSVSIVGSLNTLNPYIVKPGSPIWAGNPVHFRQVGHCLLALLFAVVGALWSRVAYARANRPAGRGSEHVVPPPPA